MPYHCRPRHRKLRDSRFYEGGDVEGDKGFAIPARALENDIGVSLPQQGYRREPEQEDTGTYLVIDWIRTSNDDTSAKSYIEKFL